MTEQQTEQETASEIGPDAVLVRRPSPQIEWVEVEGEIVAWNEDREALHLLDPVASLVFQLMDGTATVATTVDDLAEAFGRPVGEIERDVQACVAHLVDLGMIEPVR